MTPKWYALRIKPHKERVVKQRLSAEEIPTYLPTLRVNPKNPRAAKQKPYFPGYLFVRVDLEKLGRGALSWMPGTLGLVEFGGIAAPVPDTLIAALKEKLTGLNTANPKQAQLKKGDRVRIVDGPFAGYEAIFDTALPGSERVQILLAFLSQHPHPMRIDADSIEKE